MKGTKLLRYAFLRVLRALPTLCGIVLLNFLLIQLAPGDVAEVLAGEAGGAPPEYVQQLRERMGLDRPLPVRLALYAKSVVSLDLGFSFRNNAKVADLIAERFLPTLLLMGSAFVLSVLLGVALGVVTSRDVNSVRGDLISALIVIAYATPLFWVGLMLLLVFSVWLGWFPAAGMENVIAFHTGWRRVLDIAHHLVLPSMTLALYYTAMYARLMRTTMLEQQEQDYVITARAKGLGESAITVRHVFPNAVLPVVTMAGIQCGALLGGSVVVETVFAWPGLGTLAYQALFSRDLNLLLAVFLMCAVTVVVVNILVDVTYMLIDPRIVVS